MKKYLLGIIALVTAITLNSFTLRSSGHPTATKNFIYTTYPDDSNSNDPDAYMLSGHGGTDALNCPGTLHTCGVVAQDDGSGHPDLTQPYTIKYRN